MSRIRVAYTAGAAIGPELFRFYRSMGINLKQSLRPDRKPAPIVCLQPDGQIKFDLVGQPAPGRRDQDRRQRRGAGQAPMLLANTTSARMPRLRRSTPTAGS